MKHFGIRAKFILLLLILLLALFSAVAFVLVRQNSANLRKTLNEQSVAFGKLATNPIGDSFLLYQDSGRIRIQQQVDKFKDLNPDVSGVSVVDISGKELFNTGEKINGSVTPDQAASFEAVYEYNKQDEIIRVVQPYVENFGAHRYSVVYTVSSERVDNAILQEKKTIIALSAAGVVISLTLMYQLINRLFVKPVRSVSQLALAVSGGNLQQQIELQRQDEIGDLANSVNKMANSLKADIEKLKEVDKMKSEFMMIASHNLRTPLSIIDGYLEMADALQISPEIKNILDTVSANSIRLGRFAEDMLIISTIESGHIELEKKSTEINPVFEEIGADFTKLAGQKKLELTWENKTAGYEANLSKTHFRSSVWNLLDNAFKFTPEAGKVGFSANVRDDMLTIKVSDSGAGIAASEMSKLFTKFHRATSTMTYDYEGTGIGLYLTKLIVEQHGGAVAADSTEGKGSTFTITMPVQATKPKT